MNSIKRIKGYGRTAEYKLVFKEEVNKPTYITHINTIVKSQPYLDFVDELEVHGNHNEKITRKVYAKNSYEEIEDKQITETDKYKLCKVIQVDRDELIDYIKEINKYYRIVKSYNDIVTVELYNVKEKPRRIIDTSKKDSYLKKEGYELLYTYNGPYITVLDIINNDTSYYLDYAIQYNKRKQSYKIWGRYNLDNYVDKYAYDINGHINIKTFSHTNPYFIYKYIETNLNDNLFNIQLKNHWFYIHIVNTPQEVFAYYDNEINKVKATLNKLENQRDRIKENIIKEKEYTYWYIDANFMPKQTTSKHTDEDAYRKAIGNVFTSYELCREACHKILNSL